MDLIWSAMFSFNLIEWICNAKNEVCWFGMCVCLGLGLGLERNEISLRLNQTLINSFTRKVCVHQRKFCNMTNKFHYVNKTRTPARLPACVCAWMCICFSWLLEWAKHSPSGFQFIYSNKKFCLRLYGWSNDPWFVHSFTTFHFDRSISIACRQVSHTPNWIRFVF